MMIKLIVGPGNGELLIPPRTFGKLLHLARFHGWLPEKLPAEWPSESWNTEVILPHLGPYLPGPVSESDGLALAEALREVMRSESGLLDGEEYVGLLTLLKAATQGSFEVEMVTAEDAVAGG
jgi:hypothetical protein